MTDRDYGCNASSPVDIIAVILDDAGKALEIVRELNALGFDIVPKDLFEREIRYFGEIPL